MALYKLFPRHKAIQQKTNEDPVSYKNTAFSTDHVRILLFQECDFRGRKLLFDHDATEKVPMDKTEQDKKFIEVTNNVGYFISKQNSDYHQISEMVFGSVAMSFQGSYFKIHHLNSPTKLMFTHVFQSPHGRRQGISNSSQPSRVSSPSSFEHSGGSSTFSTSDRLSDRSTASDTVLVCRRLQSSPLDVPRISSSISRNSLAVDSGFTEHSFSSFSTGPVTFSTWESLFANCAGYSFPSCYAFKRLLRNSTRSLQQSSTSLPNSTEEVLPKHRHRVSKLGLCIIVEIPAESKEFLIQFLMEHIALLDALIWRTRQSIEQAYYRPAVFISSMMDIAQSTACGLVNILNAPRILINLWQTLSTDCDNRISINSLVPENGLRQTGRISSNEALWGVEKNSCRMRLVNSFNGYPTGKQDRTDVFNFSFVNFFKTDAEKNTRKGFGGEGFIGDKFLREFCELVEVYDVKDTNFFISTLLTAVLTHHLGWVSTVFPTDRDIISSKVPYNALWGQLVDMYGAVGYPVKIAQTVITGTNKNRIITKILNSLTYFIRFNSIERKHTERVSVERENRYAEMIFSQNNCIPKEYYKSYEDHLREMLSDENNKPKSPSSQTKNKKNHNEKTLKPQKATRGLTKVKTHGDLAAMNNAESSGTLQQKDMKDARKCSNIHYEDLSVIDSKNKKLVQSTPLNDIENKTDYEKIDYCDMNKAVLDATCEKNNVIFVLGDNDKLVGLKRDEAQTECSTIGSGARRKISTVKRPSTLNFSKTTAEPLKRVDTKVSDLSKSDKRCLKSRSSLESLCLEEKDLKVVPFKPNESKTFTRAQSEPPENKKLTSPRYQYSQVKFNLQQYPQVVKNYMKSKNIELEGFSLGEKVFDKFATVQYNISLDFSGYGSDSEQVEGLQTPSNASEMEFTSDMCVDTREEQKPASPVFENTGKMMKIVNIPMPRTSVSESLEPSIPYSSTVIKGLVEQYIPDMVLQGTTSPQAHWESKLKKNLARQTQHSLLDQPVEEALAVVASTDTWEVQLMSSHTYVIDKGSNGVRIGMSQLVANMLETLLHMWKAHIPTQHCLKHIEQKLQELCLRSRALAQLLLASEFCSIELLTSALKVEVNDVPLLMAVASTHTPQVTQKYGLSFQ
ncbi:folliculin-interacting protein 2 [Rhynchophorus ferrugineus]|uniref:folliculin-interacting protein 2 n=1 Tax=Rhynchophorus ferrugineus TaxID=354439 RepID=UPI003FCE3819